MMVRYLAALLVFSLMACKGEKGEKGDPGPTPMVAVGGGILGDGSPEAPLAVAFGTTDTTVARGAHSHDFATLMAVPPALQTPVPNGIQSTLVEEIRINAWADCGTIAPPPRMEVFVNGALIGASDVTSATPAAYSFAVSPSRHASEIAVAFINHNSSGGCDHRIHIVSVTLVALGGEMVTLPANDQAHAFLDKATDVVATDRSLYFDGVDVDLATGELAGNGALRFFLSPPSSRQGAPAVYQIGVATRRLPIGSTSVANRVIRGPALVAAYWSALASNSTAGGATYSRIVLDGNDVTAPAGVRNGSSPDYWFSQSNSWAGVLGPGSHTIEVRVTADTGDGELGGGDLTILAWSF